jgi:hypothetical protein|tara:strand:+ start:1275 stop:1466 length:192 start_codon:yes stop_codon:yes gene_type:complete
MLFFFCVLFIPENEVIPGNVLGKSWECLGNELGMTFFEGYDGNVSVLEGRIFAIILLDFLIDF